MYVGRIVAVGGPGAAGLRPCIGSRRARSLTAARRRWARAVAVVPKPGFETDIHKSAYIAYNCLRTRGQLRGRQQRHPHRPHRREARRRYGHARRARASCCRSSTSSVTTTRHAAHCRYRRSPPRGAPRSAIVRRDALLVRQFELDERRGAVRGHLRAQTMRGANSATGRSTPRRPSKDVITCSAAASSPTSSSPCSPSARSRRPTASPWRQQSTRDRPHGAARPRDCGWSPRRPTSPTPGP